MLPKCLVGVMLASCLYWAAPSPASCAISAAYLRCEYHVDPEGIDAPHPRLSWFLQSRERGERQTAYRILVASTPDLLRKDRGDLWDTGRVQSSESIQIAYSGKPLASLQRCWWKVQVWDRAGRPSPWSRTAYWSMGLLHRGDWKAEWIGCSIPRDKMPDPVYLPAPFLRKTFHIARPATRAVVFATAAGLYELYIDGIRVGKDCLTPGWTEYSKRLYYQAYDVTGLLKKPGAHVLGAILGDGWYGLHHGGRGRLALLAQLHLWLEDGQTQVVPTDGTWKTTYHGPILNSDIYNGETYDARREVPDWCTPEFDDSAWRPVRVGFGGQSAGGYRDVTQTVRSAVQGNTLKIAASNDLFGDPAYGFVKTLRVEFRRGGRMQRRSVLEGQTLVIEGITAEDIRRATYGASGASADVENAVLQRHPGSPVRKIMELHPVRITEPRPSVYVFDFGQNFAGWARLHLTGTTGRKITLRFAEMLNPDGTIYTANLRGAKCTDTYICKGGEETWEPRFTFHGFRYVEATGLDQKPDAGTVTGIVLSSDAPRTSDFTCSNPLLNRLYQNIVWGQRSNYLEVPTDCPQRDERMGWSGDAQVFIGTGVYNEDVAPFFTAWLNTYNDDQYPDGGYPNIAPRGGGVSPAWGDAGIICPWTLWRTYSDTRILEEHWPNMERWITYLTERSKDLVRPAEGFGDWLNVNAPMPTDVIATAYFAHSTQLMAQMAQALGKAQEATKYSDLFRKIRQAFNRAFVSPDGRIKGDTQTTYLMALGFDLLPPEKRPAAVARLVELIRERNNHLSVGFLGVNLLLPVLTDAGRTDLAWTLLTNTTYPSWLYAVTQGATTIWERWDGWTKERGFQDPGMNSFNHYAYGSCGQWMFADAAGIASDGPSYKHILIHPRPGGGITFVKAHYDSIRGRISTSWSETGSDFRLEVSLPANTTAEVYVPAHAASSVFESGKPASHSPGVRFLRMEGGCAVFEVASGTYRFVSHAAH
ncbi:MAG: glycoside hydrolase family 78 protein [Chthonomonadales bacterium]